MNEEVKRKFFLYDNTYTTLPDTMTIMDMINLILKSDYQSEDLSNINDLADLMTKAISVSFDYFWQKEVRAKADRIKKTFNKIDKVKYKICCDKCGKQSENLELHHKQPVCQGGGNELSNIMFLCKECHIKCHNELFNNKDEEKEF